MLSGPMPLPTPMAAHMSGKPRNPPETQADQWNETVDMFIELLGGLEHVLFLTCVGNSQPN